MFWTGGIAQAVSPFVTVTACGGIRNKCFCEKMWRSCSCQVYFKLIYRGWCHLARNKQQRFTYRSTVLAAPTVSIVFFFLFFFVFILYCLLKNPFLGVCKKVSFIAFIHSLTVLTLLSVTSEWNKSVEVDRSVVCFSLFGLIPSHSLRLSAGSQSKKVCDKVDGRW